MALPPRPSRSDWAATFGTRIGYPIPEDFNSTTRLRAYPSTQDAESASGRIARNKHFRPWRLRLS
ncbi:MAG: hypothetical protein MnENMB40S_14750 [Rhizobiaceae bacterium MnEN-MB40S]|nr:MAG: hypothetical protein MnENMB40S_14750 [Rhizobiaceae bacterium MnEN-MB40S]